MTVQDSRFGIQFYWQNKYGMFRPWVWVPLARKLWLNICGRRSGEVNSWMDGKMPDGKPDDLNMEWIEH